MNKPTSVFVDKSKVLTIFKSLKKSFLDPSLYFSFLNITKYLGIDFPKYNGAVMESCSL